MCQYCNLACIFILPASYHVGDGPLKQLDDLPYPRAALMLILMLCDTIHQYKIRKQDIKNFSLIELVVY